MTKPFTFSIIFSLVLTTVVAAQESGLELFGSDVDVVLRLAEPDKSIESLVELVNAAQPGFGEIARGAVGQNLGQVISNPTLVGVDQSRDWHVGIYGQGKAEPRVVFAIPAVEPDDVVAALSDNFKSSIHGKFVLYTDKGELPAVPEVSASLATKMGKESRAAFAMGEVSLYVNSKHLAAEYSEEIDTAYDQVLEGLNQLRFAIPQDSGVNMGPVIEMYGTLAEKVFQGVRDAESLVIAIDFGAQGVRIEEYLNFGEKTKSAKTLATLPTSKMADLSQLPDGAVAYYGVSGGLKDMIQWSMGLTADMSEESGIREKMEKVSDSLADVKFGSMVGSLTLGDAQDGIIRAASIAHVEPVDQFKEYMRASMNVMKEIKMPGMTQTSTLQEDAESYGDFKADLVTIKQEFDEDLPQAEMQEKMQQLMFGSTGIQSRILYTKDQYVTVMGGGKAVAQTLFESLGKTQNESVAAPRKILMEEANLIWLTDLPGAIAGGLKIASTMDEFPIPLDAQMIDNLGLVPSFVGLGVAVEGNAIRCRTDLPIGQIQGLFKLSMLFIGMQNQL